LIYAVQNKIPYGSVKNAAGEFVKGFTRERYRPRPPRSKMPPDFRVSITNAPARMPYADLPVLPGSSFPSQSKDAAKGKIISDFLNWMVDERQKYDVWPCDLRPCAGHGRQKVQGRIKASFA